MFKKMIVPALVLAATSAAAIPAAAQSYHGPYGPNHGPNRPPVVSTGYGSWQSINQRQVNLDRRIDLVVQRLDIPPDRAQVKSIPGDHIGPGDVGRRRAGSLLKVLHEGGTNPVDQ